MNRQISLRIASMTLALSIAGLFVVAREQNSSAAMDVPSRALNSQHTQWVSQSLQKMQTIKVGMTRAQLMKVFATEGGLSTRTGRRYVYRECPYFKVDVEFKAVGKSEKYPHAESRNDVIAKISQPFLEGSIGD